MKSKWWQGSLFYILILLAIIALAFSLFPTSNKPEKVDFFTFMIRT